MLITISKKLILQFLPKNLKEYASHAQQHSKQWFSYLYIIYKYIHQAQLTNPNVHIKIKKLGLNLLTVKERIKILKKELATI